MPKYLSGRSKLIRQSELSADRYKYLSIENAEPNLGDPLVGPSSITAKTPPPGQQFIVVSVEGDEPGERYWITNQGGIIPGSISVFDDNVLVGALSSITQLNFVGAAITASVSIASSNLATVRVFSPGNNQEIIFNTSNEFSTSTKLKFDPSNGLLTAGDRIIVGAGGTVITTTGVGSVGIGTTDPTQELHVQGDLRLTGTIYDYNNQPGTNTQLLVKNNFGGLTWINQGTIRAGAGGTYSNIQFHNNAGLVDGAPNFVFDEVNSRIGIGSTQPKVLLDVLGISSFNGGTTIDNLNVTGVTTTRNLTVTGVSTVGFVTGTSAFFTGIVTATKFVGEVNVSNLYVTGISTFLQKVNVNSDLGVTGLTTTQNFQVYQSTTLNRLNATGVSTFTTIGTQNLNATGVSTFTSQVNINNLNVTGVGTFDNIKIDSNTISTNVGNLILDSIGGTTQINDAIFVNDATESNDKDQGSIVTNGGVGIEKNLNVGGQLNVGGATTLASAGGITTTGGDLYVKGNLYVSDDIFYDELFARNGYFTGITSTKDLNVTGIATIATLGVTGLTTTKDLLVTGIATIATLGVTGLTTTKDLLVTGIATIATLGVTGLTTTKNLIVTGIATIATLGVTGLTTTRDLLVTGISTFQGNVTLGDASSDIVTYNSRVGSGITPSTNSSSGTDVDGKDLGGTSNYWRKIYAREFNGQFIGNAETASQVSTGTTTGTETYYPTFVDSNNSTRGNEFLYTDAGISYNPSTNSLGIGTTNPSSKLYVVGDALITGITTSAEFIGGGSDLRNLSGTHLVSYASHSETSNSALSIAGINTYTQVGILTGSLAVDSSDNFGYSVATSADGKTIIVGATSDEIGANSASGVVYVYDRVGNSFNQVGILTGSLAVDSSDNFGLSVATSADGKTIVVGAVLDEIGATGSTGVVYVFDRVGNSFNQVGILTGSLAVDVDYFGWYVATSADGKTIVVGATNDEIGANDGSGVVYVYDRVGSSFNQVGILTGSLAVDSSDNFGYSVATSADGKTIIVGADYDEVPGSGNTSGVVYVYDRVGSSFNQVGILTGSLAVDVDDRFGVAVATSADGKTIIVGATSDEVPGSDSGSGVVYVYDRVGSSFNRVGILTGSLAVNANDIFGYPVATSADGKTIIVGAYLDEIGATGSTGVVYVFNRQGNSFNQVGILTGSLAVDSGDRFGFDVAVSADGKTIIVGAYADEIGATSGTGVAYVFDQTRDTYVYSGPTGNIGIGTTNPGEKLQVDGNIRVGSSTTSNYIAFRGTNLDDQTRYTHTFIGERLYNSFESSELLLFKGNDIYNVSGPDRIRLAAAEFRFDTIAADTLGTFEQVATSPNVTNKMIVTGIGSVGIGTINPTSKLQVAGDVTPSVTNTYDLGTLSLKWKDIHATTFNGTFAFASDIRLKTNIEYIENAVDRVMKLSGFTYNFNEKGSELGFDSSVRYSGVSAQEVQEVLPEAVSPAPISNEYLTVQYDKLVPLLIEAIKEQQETIANLQKRIETFENN